MARRETAADVGANYARCPEGWLLAHNPVRPESPDQPHGVNGFRRFWISPLKQKQRNSGWKLCNCGWRPDLGPHYSRLG